MPYELEMSIDKTKDDEFLIRAAKPDKDEGILFAQYLNEASEGFFKSILGDKTFDIFSDAYLQPDNEYSFENVFMIEYKNKVVGMLSAFTTAEKESFNKDILSQFSKGAKLRIMLFSLVGIILLRFLGPRGKDEYYIQGIAVSSHLRGKGIGQRLLKHAAETAIKKGSKTLSLDVSSKNIKAIKSYKKFDMEVSSDWPNFLNLPSVFTKMEKKL